MDYSLSKIDSSNHQTTWLYKYKILKSHCEGKKEKKGESSHFYDHNSYAKEVIPDNSQTNLQKLVYLYL